MKSIRNILLFCLMAVTGFQTSARETIDFETPAMQVFLPDSDKTTGRVVIVCPGGSYLGHAYQHEGTQWSDMFNDLGITAVVLRYSLPAGDRTRPMGDVYKAMDIIRQNADAWKINPEDIGIMGSSAGGHLASTIATHSAPEYTPTFQILFYPVISMERPLTHEDSHNNFLGNNPGADLEAEFTNYKQVKPNTPRAIIFFSSDDTVVPVMNGVEYYKALNKAGVPASLHIYPTGGHGWGYNASFPYHDEVVKELSTWLKSF